MDSLIVRFCLVLVLALSCSVEAARLAPPLPQQAEAPVTSPTGAEVLQSRQSVVIADDLNWESVEYYSIRINDLQAARDYGRISISHNHYYSDLDLEFANVLSPQGVLKSVKSDALQERVGGSQDFYEDRTSLVFSLPDITPGAIIEIQFRRKSKKVIMPGLFNDVASPYWFQPTVGGDSGRMDPVHVSRYQLQYPPDLRIFSRSVGPGKAAHKRQKSRDLRTDAWEWKNMPAIPIETAQEPVDVLMSRIRISTITDWRQVSRWSWELTRDKLAHQNEVADVARSLVAIDADRDAKVRAVYSYLQENVRYVFAHLGRGGYEPHFAREVIQQGYGDCKDQTVLAVALLKELGITAYPALVVTPRNSRPTTDLVSLIFDHMIVYIPPQGNQPELWLDTTSDHALFPGISNYLVNQSVLVADGSSGQLVTLNHYLPDNKVQLYLDYNIDEKNRITVDADIAMSGVFEQNFRNWWIHNSNRETDLEQMIGNIFPDANGSVSIHSEVVNDKSLWHPIAVKVTFDFGPQEDIDTPPTYGTGLSQVYRMFGSFSSLQVPRERKSRWVSELESTMSVHTTFRGKHFDIPVVIASGNDVSNDFFLIRQLGRQGEDNSYQVDIQYTQPPLNLSVDQYRHYYEALKDFSGAGYWAVRFATDKAAAERQALDSQQSNSVTALLAKVRFHLDQGEFNQALAPAQTAVEKYADNGEAWYLLGIAQGYNAMINESRRSFARAAELNYQP